MAMEDGITAQWIILIGLVILNRDILAQILDCRKQRQKFWCGGKVHSNQAGTAFGVGKGGESLVCCKRCTDVFYSPYRMNDQQEGFGSGALGIALAPRFENKEARMLIQREDHVKILTRISTSMTVEDDCSFKQYRFISFTSEYWEWRIQAMEFVHIQEI